MKDENNLVYIELQDDLFWSASCQGFAFGELSNDYKVPDLQTSFVRDGRIYSTFDSGSAQIQMPDPLFEPFVRQIFEKAGVSADDYQISSGRILTQCHETMPPLHFMFDKIWLTVDVDDYMLDVSEAQDRSQCYLLIAQGEMPFLVLGLPLFSGYYTIHDDVGGRMGFAAGIRSSKTGPYWGAIPTSEFSDEET